ncbi:MAG: Holliday junction resolvase RuvX [Candidatus Moranbacteria bacterium]|nr:Holliday junction resolvase RuvX [Candidatus Moranbacteria bacterium]
MSITIPKKPVTSHILGIDYGESKVGLAVGDSETRMAFGYATLENDKNLFQKLAEIIEKENISKVIIGVASYINKESSIYPGEKLGNFLKEKLKVEVEYQDEMFTTREAQRNLIEKGVKGIKKFDDQEAARLILQGWLDKQK